MTLPNNDFEIAQLQNADGGDNPAKIEAEPLPVARMLVGNNSGKYKGSQP